MASMFDHYHPADHPDFTREGAGADRQQLWMADLIQRMVNVEHKLRAPMLAIKKGRPGSKLAYTPEDLFNLANELVIPTPVREALGLPVVEREENPDAAI